MPVPSVSPEPLEPAEAKRRWAFVLPSVDSPFSGDSTCYALMCSSTCILTAAANWKDMANLVINDCADSDGQTFDVKADGRIAVAASSPQECVDLQYMKAAANNPVGLYSCAGLNNVGAADKGINWPLAAAT